MSSEAGLPAFDALLKETVTAKRLSANKINQLSDMAKRLLKHDTHIISILYKTHRSLPPKSTQKINSLYTFNALATTAKTMVDKGVARKGDANAELGAGFATGFLNKMEGVLEGLVSDMADGWTEGQEKVRKVLEIWKKSNTFSPSTLSDLNARLEGAISRNASGNGNGVAVTRGSESGAISSSSKMREKDQTRRVESIQVPQKQGRSSTPDGYPTTPPPQAALPLPTTDAAPSLAAAFPATSSTPSAAPLNPISLDPALLATLAQLTQQKPTFPITPAPASSGPLHRIPSFTPPFTVASQSSHPLIRPPPPPASISASSSASASAPAPTYDAALAKRDEFARKMTAMSAPPSTPSSTPSYAPQGRPTQSFSGSAEAGPSGYQATTPQTNRYNHDDRPSTNRYGAMQQSRSPSQDESARSQYHTQPTQPSQSISEPTAQKRPAAAMGSAEGEEEEEMEMDLESDDEDNGFGKRKSGLSGGEVNKKPRIEGVKIAVSTSSLEKLAAGDVSRPAPSGLLAVAPSPPSPLPPPPTSSEPTLDTYDVATFNPMSPESWAALGKAWRNSNRGAEPTPEALMMFLMTKGVGMPGMGGGGGGDGMASGMMGGGGGRSSAQWSGNDGSHEQVRGSWDDGPYADYSSGRGRGRGR